MENSYLIRQERCPECAKQGKDTSGNNLAVYSDGHQFCYSCSYYVPSNGIARFKSKNEPELIKHEVVLPSDSDVNYPARAIEWINKYELTRNDLLTNNVIWSENKQRLIFPVYGPTGLIAYQGRYFGEDKEVKWYGRGNLKDTFHILGRSSSQLVLVEDIVSAIKLAKFTEAMPLFGSHVGIERFKRLRKLIEPSVEVFLYLDPDMRRKSIVEARIGSMVGLNMRVIYSGADPKEESYETLKEILKC